jgi:phosphate starvation-inducible protein PhoH
MDYKHKNKGPGKTKKFKNNFLLGPPSFEWTPKQKEILDTMNDPKTACVILNALAGTGKTTLAVYSALQHLQAGLIEKIIYVRTAVEASHSKLGYLKGSLDDKFGPYAEILTEKAKDFLNPTEIEGFMAEGKLEARPVSFLRGHDFKNSIVILDEAQNAYLNEICTISTRISLNSKIFILADEDQCDLPKNAQNEFMTFVKIFSDEESRENHIHYYELKDEMDVMRSPFVRYVSKKYSNYKKSLVS